MTQVRKWREEIVSNFVDFTNLTCPAMRRLEFAVYKSQMICGQSNQSSTIVNYSGKLPIV